MPIHKVEGGWKWGEQGHTYSTRAGAEAQAAAAYAHGYTGDATAAGVALQAPSGKLLFLKRSASGDHPGEWCFPGGRIEEAESPLDAALRELYEEAGIIAAGQIEAIDDNDEFVTFSGEADFEVKPVLNLEHTEYVWADPVSPPQPLHPGVSKTLTAYLEDAKDPSGHGSEKRGGGTLAERFQQRIRAQIKAQNEAVARHNRENPNALKNSRTIQGVKDFSGYYAPEKVGKTRRTTPEGFLVLEGVPVARTGQQIYAANEIEGIEPNGSGYIVVERPPEEVFREETLASGEGKDFVIEHPPDGVDPENWKNHTVGHAQNFRQGEGIEDDLILADIMIKDPMAIEYVNKHLPEISLGYLADYEQVEPGKAIQRNIIINHIAGVKAGRAGARVAVRDHSPGEDDMSGTAPTRKKYSWQAVREWLLAKGLKTSDADTLSTEFQMDSSDASDGELMQTIAGMDAAIKDMRTRLDARDAAEKAVKDAKDAADAAARDAKEKEEGEGKKYEETGDTIIEAETVGHVLNLGKTWQGALTGDSATPEPVLTAVIARAEILAPGIAKPTPTSICGNKGVVLTKFMRDALRAHVATADGAANFANFTNQKVDDLGGMALVGVFNGTSQLARAKHNTQTRTAVQGKLTGDFSRPKSASDINEQNKQFWAGQAGGAAKH